MREVEAKFLEIDPDTVTATLEDMGAELVFDDEIETWVFDFPDNRLHESHRLLRVRRLGDTYRVMYKEPVEKEEAKIMEEYGTVIQDVDAVKTMLHGLGLKQVMHHVKHRVSYTLNSVRFEIDDYPEIPVFLEIEAPDKNMIREYAEKLGLNPDEATPMSAYDLFEHYGKNPRATQH